MMEWLGISLYRAGAEAGSDEPSPSAPARRSHDSAFAGGDRLAAPLPRRYRAASAAEGAAVGRARRVRLFGGRLVVLELVSPPFRSGSFCRTARLQGYRRARPP